VGFTGTDKMRHPGQRRFGKTSSRFAPLHESLFPARQELSGAQNFLQHLEGRASHPCLSEMDKLGTDIWTGMFYWSSDYVHSVKVLIAAERSGDAIAHRKNFDAQAINY
jgi:hypothetical protein